MQGCGKREPGKIQFHEFHLQEKKTSLKESKWWSNQDGGIITNKRTTNIMI